MEKTLEQQIENLKQQAMDLEKSLQEQQEKARVTPNFVTLKEAAQILKASEGTVRRWVKSGLIRARNIGRKYLVSVEDLSVK